MIHAIAEAQSAFLPDPIEKLVLLAFADWMDPNGQGVPCITSLQDYTSQSEMTIRAAVQRLEASHHITRSTYSEGPEEGEPCFQINSKAWRMAHIEYEAEEQRDAEEKLEQRELAV